MPAKAAQAGMILLGMACFAWAEVAITYAPTSIAPGVPTQLTISATDQTGTGLEIVGVVIQFEAPQQLAISNFSWLSGLDEEEAWWAIVGLPNPQTVPLGNSRLDVAPDATVNICTLTVTADPVAEGSVLTLVVFPEGSDAGIHHDVSSFRQLDITAGRSVDLTVASSSGDDSSDGDGGSGGGTDGGTGSGDTGGGDDGGGDDGDQTDDGTDGDTDGQDGSEPDDGDGEPDDEAGDDQGNGDGSANDNGSSTGDDIATDEDQGQDGDQPTDGDGGGQDTQEPGDDGDDDGNGNANDSGGGPAPVSICGMGMIPFGLFTLAGLSVMKLQPRRRRL